MGPGTRVWHAHLPNWPGVVVRDDDGRWMHTSDGNVFVLVDFERRTERMANPIYVRTQSLLLTEPRECDR